MRNPGDHHTVNVRAVRRRNRCARWWAAHHIAASVDENRITAGNHSECGRALSKLLRGPVLLHLGQQCLLPVGESGVLLGEGGRCERILGALGVQDEQANQATAEHGDH